MSLQYNKKQAKRPIKKKQQALKDSAAQESKQKTKKIKLNNKTIICC